jgi:hypothetical protein
VAVKLERVWVLREGLNLMPWVVETMKGDVLAFRIMISLPNWFMDDRR